MNDTERIRAQVRDRYAQAARAVGTGGRELLMRAADCCASGSCCTPTTGNGTDLDERFGVRLYAAGETVDLPAGALAASLGCGNPAAVASLHPGERVLDLGSGGGIDVLLSARRVSPTGFAYGVDMTDEMLALARANAVRAGADNVEFVKGTIEDVPLADATVDVVISNCVINLSADKPKVMTEMFRVLVPGGRIGISDVVAEDGVSPAERAQRGSYVGCIAGALSRVEYLDGLARAGFTDVSVEFTHNVALSMHGAIIKATKPAVETAR